MRTIPEKCIYIYSRPCFLHVLLLLLQKVMTEDEELAMALAMSVEDGEPAAAPSSASAEPQQGASQTNVHSLQENAPIQTEAKEENLMAAANGADAQVSCAHQKHTSFLELW